MDGSAVIDLLDAPAVLLCAVLWTRLLPMRLPVLFVAGYLTIPLMNVVADLAVGPEMPHDSNPVYMVIGAAGALWMLVVQLVVPFFLLEGKAPLRAFVALLTCVAYSLCEFVAFGLWTLLFGPSSTDGAVYYAHALQYVPEYILVQFVRMLAILAIFFVLRASLRRWSSDGSTRAWFYVAFPGVQVFLFTLAAVASCMFEVDKVFFVSLCALGAFCVVLDVLLFWAMDRSGQKHLHDERVKLLQRQLDGYLIQYDSVVDDIEQASKMRHDFRNQLQTVIMLAERGERARAQAYLDDLVHALE